MYAMSRRGEITNFTGRDDIYEVPEASEITLDTVSHSACENAGMIVEYLRAEGFLKQGVHANAVAAGG
jgi:adenylylsulfate kinase-like enzyme